MRAATGYSRLSLFQPIAPADNNEHVSTYVLRPDDPCTTQHNVVDNDSNLEIYDNTNESERGSIHGTTC